MRKLMFQTNILKHGSNKADRAQVHRRNGSKDGAACQEEGSQQGGHLQGHHQDVHQKSSSEGSDQEASQIQAGSCRPERDPEISAEHQALDQEAALPASGEGDLPGLRSWHQVPDFRCLGSPGKNDFQD